MNIRRKPLEPAPVEAHLNKTNETGGTGVAVAVAVAAGMTGVGVGSVADQQAAQSSSRRKFRGFPLSR